MKLIDLPPSLLNEAQRPQFAPVRKGESFASELLDNPNSPWVLIACCGKKLDHPAAAEDLYQSDLFKKSRAWAEMFGVGWAILSAKYGCVPPGRVIKPYDETLNTKSPGELAQWGKLVRGQVGCMTLRRPTVILAGEKYRQWIYSGDNVIFPMQGMGIGQQLAWLKREVALGEKQERINGQHINKGEFCEKNQKRDL